MKSFLVRTVSTDFVGRLISDERIIQAPSTKSVKRSIYLSLRNIQSISIVEVAVKNWPFLIWQPCPNMIQL